MSLNPIYVPATSLDDWQKLLADPQMHWKEGFSAASLATTWFQASGFPASVATILAASPEPFGTLAPLLMLPEHKVKLPGGNRPTQNDIWILGRHAEGLASIAVEGKADESFGPTLAEWNLNPSEGKVERLTFLKTLLGLEQELPGQLRYQLLHRTASAVIEAERFNADTALMLVHSFSSSDSGFSDFQLFAQLFCANVAPDRIYRIGNHGLTAIYIAWVRNPATS